MGYRGDLGLPGVPDLARALAFAWSRSGWRALRLPIGHGGFTSVTCVHAADCVAVGETGPSLGMAEHWYGVDWKPLKVANP